MDLFTWVNKQMYVILFLKLKPEVSLLLLTDLTVVVLRRRARAAPFSFLSSLTLFFVVVIVASSDNNPVELYLNATCGGCLCRNAYLFRKH